MAGKPTSQMYYVYLLQSRSHPAQQYIGLTRPPQTTGATQQRNVTSYQEVCLWGLLAYFAFKSEAIASAFERYLKSGSGRAFVKRHFRVREAVRKD
jgi:putative endonuclease